MKKSSDSAEKSNEITVIPELLRVLELTVCIVTIDVMGTQKTGVIEACCRTIVGKRYR